MVAVLHDCGYCGSGCFVVCGCSVVAGFSSAVIAEVALWLWLLVVCVYLWLVVAVGTLVCFLSVIVVA